MESVKQVVWKEGIFISPQHFQQQDQHNKSYLHDYVSAVAFPRHYYGISLITVNADLLRIGKIAVSACHGVFPDGHYFKFDHEISIAVPDDTVKATLYLRLPLALQGACTFGGEKDGDVRYQCETATVFDNTSRESDSLEIEVGRDNLSLAIGEDDLAGYTSIPIATILEVRESGEVVFDKSFVPACIHFQASVYLIDQLTVLHTLLQNRIQQVYKRINAGQGSKSEQTLYKDYLWLQTLNRWLPWSNWVQSSLQYPTHELYRDLTTMCAEFCSLTPEMAPDFEKLEFDSLYQVFSPIFNKLRSLLSLVLQDSVIEYQWDRQLFEKRRLLRTIIRNPDAMRDRRFVLSAESSIGAAKLAEVLPSAATVAGNSRIVELVRNALSGVELSAMGVAPNELKPKASCAYFEINGESELWQDMLNKGEALTLHLDARVPDLEVVLYAI